MNSYSEDLREKIVEVPRRGRSKSGEARVFGAVGVNRSSVKRYAKLAEEGHPRSEEPARLQAEDGRMYFG